jgi:hypothetical protein
MTTPDFSRLFEDGRVIKTAEWVVTLRSRAAGELVLTTGRAVACDPFTSPDEEPFTRELPTGSFPVVLSVAHFDDGDQRVAAAMVRFADALAVRWEMALVGEDDPSELGEGEIFGYAVESGTGCFMDVEAAESLMDRVEEDERYFETVVAALTANEVDTWSWASFVPGEGAANVVAFSSGVGDETYASYFGLDADGNVVSLVTDFSLFEPEEMS